MYFTKISDKKLRDWIYEWENLIPIRVINPYETYVEALTESFKRFSDQSYWKIEYFKEHPGSTIEDFYTWFREI